MIKTVLMDYDSTIHDMDGVMERSLDGVLGYSGADLYRVWVFDVHRAIIHTRHLDRHDDMMFHCRLLFDHLGLPFDEAAAQEICARFEEANERAQADPVYYPDAIPALDQLKEMGVAICLSTGFGAERKAETLEKRAGRKYFTETFSERRLGPLKTEPGYYMRALSALGGRALGDREHRGHASQRYKAGQAGGHLDHLGKQGRGGEADEPRSAAGFRGREPDGSRRDHQTHRLEEIGVVLLQFARCQVNHHLRQHDGGGAPGGAGCMSPHTCLPLWGRAWLPPPRR